MIRNVCLCMALIFAPPAAATEAASADIVATWDGGRVLRDDYDSWRNVMKLEDSPDAIREFILVQSFAEIARQRGAQNDLKVELESEISRRRILSAALRSQAVSEIRITDEEIEKLRLQYPEAFVRPRKLQLYNIYKKLGDDPAAAEAIRLQMAGLRQQLLDGADFAELARSESESQSRFKDGRLGFVDPEQLPVAIRDGVRGLRPGRISEVIESDGAVMVFRCDEITEGVTPTADEVRAKLRNNLMQIRKGEVEQSLGERLLESANVEITPRSRGVVLKVGDYQLDAEALVVLMNIKVPGSSESDWNDGAREKLLRNWAIGVLEERRAIELAVDKNASTAEALRWMPVQVLARNELVRRIDKELKAPGDAAMRSYYKQNIWRYRVPEKFTLGVISFGRVPSNDSKAAGELVAVAERAERQVASGELSFADAARRYSKAPSSSRGGEARTLTRPQLGAFGSVAAKAILELAPGQHTGLLRLSSGLWMFELRDRQPAGTKSFEEARDAISKAMRKQEVERLQILVRERQWQQLEIRIVADSEQPAARKS